MSKQVITMLGIEHSTDIVPIPDAYIAREDGRFVWLQRLCVWFLKKFGKNAMERTTKLERYVIESNDFMERIFQQRGDIVRIFNREPDTLLIGTEEFAALMNTVRPSQPFAFQAEYYHDRKIMGLTVRVIPWMEGVLVVPSTDH